MSSDFEHALNSAKNSENQLKNLLDDKTHPIGRSLLSEARQLVSEVSAKKNPRQLENRVKTILQLLHHAQGYGEQIMDIRHIQMLHHNYEHLQMALEILTTTNTGGSIWH